MPWREKEFTKVICKTLRGSSRLVTSPVLDKRRMKLMKN
jgi:hypothetical protein